MQADIKDNEMQASISAAGSQYGFDSCNVAYIQEYEKRVRFVKISPGVAICADSYYTEQYSPYNGRCIKASNTNYKPKVSPLSPETVNIALHN